MKQNKTYKILTGLALVTILTTTVIGSTMANFTSASSMDDTARVATCTLQVTGEDMFAKKYISDVSELAKSSIYSIKADEKTLAPGSKNKIDLKLNGSSEFLLDATFSLDVDLTGDWTVDGKFYCPLQFKIIKNVNGQNPIEYSVDGSTYESETDLKAALASTVKHTETLSVNTRYDDYIPVSVEWSWPFSTSEENDLKDTNLTSRPKAEPISIKIKCKSQFTQID